MFIVMVVKEIDESKLKITGQTELSLHFQESEERLKELFPDAKFYPEFDILSKNMPDSIREALKAKFPDKKINLICDSYFDVHFGENAHPLLFLRILYFQI